MIHLYTGDGKGKTTAAIGQAVRAAGRDLRVIFAQFMKGNDTGELFALKKIPAVTILRSPRNFGFYSQMSEEDKAELTEIHNELLKQILESVESGGCDLVVLDEITYPVKWGLLDGKLLEHVLALAGEPRALAELSACAGDAKLPGGVSNPSEEGSSSAGPGNPVEIVMTGRDAAEFLWESADYITEMKALRHPYEKGVTARRGIEY